MTIETIDNTPLGDRMKRYEHAYRDYLPRRTYTLMRLDGRAFHSYLRGADKPFDREFAEHMSMLAVRLCEEIQGAKFAYTQSDEISILLTDFDTNQTVPWVDGRVDKITSLSASLAGAYFNRLRSNEARLGTFDCRVFTLTDPVEVANYFVWRQRDWIRNSILMLAQHYYRQRTLDGKSTGELQDILFREQGVNWNDLDPALKRGRAVFKDPEEGWMVFAAPDFLAEPGSFLSDIIPPLPSLWK